MIFLKVAFLNMLKHLKRSLLVVGAVMLSVVVMEFAAGMMDGMRSKFFDTLLMESGHVQINAQGYRQRIDQLAIKYVIDNPDRILELIKKEKYVINAEKLIHFQAQLIYGEKNIYILGHGVQEHTAFFDRATNNIISGDFLPHGEGIVLSQRVAELIDAELNEYIVLAIFDSQGSFYYLDYPLTGIFKSDSTDFDDNNIFISHESAEELLDLPGQSIEIRVSLESPKVAESFKRAIQPIITEYQLEAATWREIFGSITILIELFDFFMFFIDIIVVIVAATLITNTLLMNIFERIREFGTMRAIGLKKRQLFSLIIVEGGAKGFAGSVAGLLVGIPLVLYFQKYGLYLGEFTEAMHMGSTLPFSFSLVSTSLNFLFGIAVACGGSLWAAWISTKMKLIDLLRYV